MTDHTQNHDVGQRARGKRPGLTLVSNRTDAGIATEAGMQPNPVLPRWAVYLLVVFYCVAIWALAFWIISALF